MAGIVELEDALKKLDRLTQEEARMALAEMLRVTHNTCDEVKIVDGKVERVENKVEEIKCSWLPKLAIICSSRLNLLAGNQFIQLLRSWLSPVDPSTNHNIARRAQHNGTAAWLFQGQIIIKWKSTGSLLWIHGKRTFPLSAFRRATLTDSDYGSGLWEECHLVCPASPPSCRNLFFA